MVAHVVQPGSIPFDRGVAAALIVVALALYLRAVDRLRARGRAIPRPQQACYLAGVSLVAIGLLSPIDAYSDELLSAHMVQHILISDFAGVLILFGIRSPLLVHFWPRPVLVAVARARAVRIVWRRVQRPRVALPIWLGALYVWHLPVLYEFALRSTPAHLAEHATFVWTGMLMWWPLLEPTRRHVDAAVWKAVYVAAARMLGGVVGIVLIVMRTPAYPVYVPHGVRLGIDPVTDQQIAGSIMMLVDFLVATVGFFGFLMRSGDSPTEPGTAAVRQRSPGGVVAP